MKKIPRGVAALAACAAAAAALTACGGSGGEDGSSDSLTVATMTLPQSLDPKDAAGSAMPFFQAAYDTLVKREPDGTYSPMLATKWEYGEDRTELTLTLRDDVKFDDGTPFDASAVKANMERFAKGGGGMAKTLADVEKIEVADAAHVVLHLKQPNPAMLFYLSDAAGLMANPARFDDAGDPLKTKPDGTGPYDLDSGKTAIGTKWTYTADTGYWGTKLPYKELTFRYFDNETAIVNGLKTGQVDAAVLQTANAQARVEKDPGVETKKQEFDFQGILLFDRGGEIAPALAEPKVRQALNYAIDRKTMLDKIRQGRGEATSQIFGTESVAFQEELDSYYSYDPAKAKRLLKEAGYADGFELKLPRISAIVPDALASSLQTYFEAIGVELTWDDMDQSAVRRIFTDREYPGMVMNMGQSANDWVAIGELVLPSTFNFFGTTDGTVQKLLPQIAGTAAKDAEAQLHELNRHLVEEAWFVPFYRLSYLHVSDGGVTIEPQSGMALPSIYNYAPAG
ncbi:ABC transporter substrate-binding protein [Actinomadura sp. CNU-125]|uniref:ABC transporter substrate-binding protein n=1 Tax=Actinomadura sp. CNU-125 TaxID=1904961 RepID=UPI000963B43E|nr:ABC transporter substrate-binding protein [Actinomadura sp. CNU-125]OLT14557.1 ABC transporter substrate-binding protein [Actinomadura sp. CNU-125]